VCVYLEGWVGEVGGRIRYQVSGVRALLASCQSSHPLPFLARVRTILTSGLGAACRYLIPGTAGNQVSGGRNQVSGFIYQVYVCMYTYLSIYIHTYIGWRDAVASAGSPDVYEGSLLVKVYRHSNALGITPALNLRDISGQTPLHEAALHGTRKLLLHAHAHVLRMHDGHCQR